MSFDVEIGHVSRRGSREVNEDFAGVRRAEAHEAARGLIAVIADGVSSGGRGREAAQTTVLGLLGDYFAAPDTWETSVVLDRLISAQNAWLADHNRRRSGLGKEGSSAMTTVTALALAGHSYTLAHVGDTRAWLLRADAPADCIQLSEDHAFEHPDQRSRLTRAIGLDHHVRVDYHQGELHVGDCFVLTSDGVHGVLKPARLAALAQQGSAQQAAEALVDAALAAGSIDNASAMVLRVRGLAPARLEDSLLEGRHLPVPGRLKVGDRLDDFTVTALVADNGVHRLYQAREGATQDLVALKVLHEARASDPEERAMLAHEAWLASRVAGDASGGNGFVRLREPGRRSAFYLVFDWHTGRTLEQLAGPGGRSFDVREVIAGGVAVARALGRLHRLGVVHRDVKPGNLHLGDDGRWRLLDLGVAISGSEPRSLRTLHAGTPSYMNPEQWSRDEHVSADTGSDLFALGVTLYQWLTGKLPYGDVEPYQTARYRRDPKPPSRMRPDVPIWLDEVVLKAVALDPKQRFETAEEFVLALERGASRPLRPRGATPLVARDPTAVWKIALGVSVLVNLLLLYWLLFLPR